MTQKKTITWTITRTVVEIYEQEAETKEQALAECHDPNSIRVIKETIKKKKL